MADDKNGAIERPASPSGAPPGAPQNKPIQPQQASTLLRPVTRSATHPNAASSGQSTNTNTGAAPSTAPSASDWQVTNPSQWDASDKLTLTAGSVLKERFTLERIVGKGGMGTVFCARDRRKEEAQDRFPFVAVKLLNEDFKRHPESLKLLQREARKAQQLAHPNIVTVYDFDRDGANVFIVMELLQGESLDRVIKQTDGKGLSVPDALRIVIELGKALSYAHEKGVIHLDFKPANAHLCRDGTVKVLDFGIARAQQRSDLPEQEQTQFQVGDLGALTPSYASLEMQAGDDPDPRDDVYALACVTYELLTGKHPFGRQSAQFALEYKLWPTRPKGLSRNGWQALQRALALQREQRTPSVNEFVTELGAKQSSVPRWTAAAAVVIAAGAVMYWQWQSQVNSPKTISATKTAIISPAQRTPTVAPPSPAAPAELLTTAPLNITQPDTAQKAQATVQQQRERLTQLARSNDIDAAMELLSTLRAALPNDPFVTQDAPQAIAAADLRLAERALQKANYAASSDYILAAQRLNPDARTQQAKDSLIATTRLDSALRNDRNLTAETIRNQLTTIKSAMPSAYPAIERNLASVLVTRIERERQTNASSSDALIAVAMQVFGHIPAVAALTKATPAKTTVSLRTETNTPAQPAPQAMVAEKPVTQPPLPLPKVEPAKQEPVVQSTKPVEPTKEEPKPKKKDKPNVIITF